MSETEGGRMGCVRAGGSFVLAVSLVAMGFVFGWGAVGCVWTGSPTHCGASFALPLAAGARRLPGGWGASVAHWAVETSSRETVAA